MPFIRKNKVGNVVYAQVVESKRINRKVEQKFICSLGRLDELIKKLQKMQNE